MKICKLIAAGALLATLAGCTSTAHLLTEEGRGTPPVSEAAASAAAEKLPVYSGREPGRRYRVLGSVIAAADGLSGERALEHLREEAAKLGADAVTELRLEIEAGYWAMATKASGLAVKFAPAAEKKGKQK